MVRNVSLALEKPGACRERVECLVAERRWDMARWSTKADAWRFAGVRRRAAVRRAR